MNLVYIILAHKNPAQLYRSIKNLRDATTIFLVHVDIVVDISSFLDLFCESEDVIFIEQRSHTRWGSFGLVEASLTMLQYVKDYFPRTDRVTLLSGQDYPIKPSKQIFNYFCANRDKIYMEFFHIPYINWNMGGINRFPNFHVISKNLEIYGGSQWWSFPIKVVDIIFSILTEYPSYIEYFRQVTVPDESFFQTLLLNSEEPLILDNLAKGHLSYISWHFPGFHPRTIKSKDFPLLMKSTKFFARKFDENIEPKILDLIDEAILRPKDFRKHKKNCQRQMHGVRQAICMLTNKQASLSRYQKLTEEIPDNASPFLLFHSIDQNVGEKFILETKNLFLFDDTILSSLGFTPIEPSLLPGSNHFPLFSLYNSQPDYDYYWLIEDDVHYNGKWTDFFDEFSPENLQADFISCHIRTRNEEPNWYWWNSLVGNNSKDIKYKLASFNPIYRISREALAYLSKQLKNGWVGHHEVLIPTLLNEAGFILLDFGGTGAFCPPSKRNKTYMSGKIHNGGTMERGSVRYRPIIQQDEIKDNLLYHPVKYS